MEDLLYQLDKLKRSNLNFELNEESEYYAIVPSNEIIEKDNLFEYSTIHGQVIYVNVTSDTTTNIINILQTFKTTPIDEDTIEKLNLIINNSTINIPKDFENINKKIYLKKKILPEIIPLL